MPYNKNLQPLPSAFRPHCLARERLLLWLPLYTPRNESRLPLLQTDLQRVFTVISHAYAPSTLETYGSGLLVFHVFCDQKGVLESQRAPASTLLLSAFVAAMAGSYSGDAIANYMAAVHAWHVLHGIEWAIDKDQLRALYKGSNRLAPPASKHISVTHDRNQLKTTSFHLPSTKCSPIEGEDVSWAKQDGLTDPEAALDHHLAVNNPLSSGEALFSYTHTDGKLKAFNSEKFSQVAGVDVPPAHGIRIGSVLEYLLRGMPFIVMQVKGRWAGPSFTKYLRQHAEVLAPYMQANSVVLADFTRIAMPPVR
ncbi:hypothetical protein BT96DRAFT_968644 [Gymnopus androsaceus JB14]|uniref:Uncharacterized protein n=1 Tax=Gymnopus androsaceus JB14 TaxID=1447944 RepID=A0A6A4GCR7_9AGAR|nr:hypothetical protein BT96DRAFT_968644 [Gymnopus androsaceus JB14]